MIDKNCHQLIDEYRGKNYESKEIKKLKNLLGMVAVELNSLSASGDPVVNNDCRITKEIFIKAKIYSPEIIEQVWSTAESRTKRENKNKALLPSEWVKCG